MLWISSPALIGFETKPSHPAAIQRSSSPAIAFAVKAMIGMSVVAASVAVLP